MFRAMILDIGVERYCIKGSSRGIITCPFLCPEYDDVLNFFVDSCDFYWPAQEGVQLSIELPLHAPFLLKPACESICNVILGI